MRFELGVEGEAVKFPRWGSQSGGRELSRKEKHKSWQGERAGPLVGLEVFTAAGAETQVSREGPGKKVGPGHGRPGVISPVQKKRMRRPIKLGSGRSRVTVLRHYAGRSDLVG